MGAQESITTFDCSFVKRTPFWHFLPPFCVFFAVRYCFSALLGRKILKLIHIVSDDYARKRRTTETKQAKENTQLSSLAPQNEVETFFLACKDRQVECFIEKNFEASVEKEKIYYKVHFPGNGVIYCSDSVSSNIPEVHETKKNIVNVYVNHTNAGDTFQYKRNSRCMEDLYATGEAVLHFLIKDQKIDPTKIILHGHSLGGVIATKVAKRCHGKGQKVKLINDRSLTSVLLFLCGHLRAFIVSGYIESKFEDEYNSNNKDGAQLKILKSPFPFKARAKFIGICAAAFLLVAPLALPVLMIFLFVLSITGMHFSAAWDYAQIPRKDKCIIEAENDYVIHKPARLSGSMYKPFYCKSKFFMQSMSGDPHNALLSDININDAIEVVALGAGK